MSVRLCDLGDPPGVNTVSTDQNAPRLTIDGGPYLLQIGMPDSLGLIIGVADVISC